MTSRRQNRFQFLRFSAPSVVFSPASKLPISILELVDPEDDDIDLIVDTILMLREFCYDIEDPAVIEGAVAAAHRRSARIEAELHSEEAVRRREESRQRTAVMAEAERLATEAKSRVYYARLGNLVKIGYSIEVKKRMSQINPEELLATEVGGPLAEKARHQQFAHLHYHGEWFRFEGALVEHVQALQAAKLCKVS